MPHNPRTFAQAEASPPRGLVATVGSSVLPLPCCWESVPQGQVKAAAAAGVDGASAVQVPPLHCAVITSGFGKQTSHWCALQCAPFCSRPSIRREVLAP